MPISNDEYKNSNAYTCPYCGWDIKMYVENAVELYEKHMSTHEKDLTSKKELGNVER